MSEDQNKNSSTAPIKDKKIRPNFRPKKSSSTNGWPDVQIFDLVLPPKEVDLAEFEEYLSIKCNDGAEILIPKIVATSTSLWMRRLLSSNFKEKQTLSVEFKEFSGIILEEILRFCIQDYMVNKPNYDDEISGKKQQARVVFQFYIHPSVVMEMLMASDFLQIPALLELSSLMLAHYIDYVPSFAGIAPDLILGVFVRVNPVKLCGLEDRPEYKALKLDTAPIWFKHCEKKDYKALGPVFSWDRNPTLKQYLDTLNIDNKPKTLHKYTYDQNHQVVEDLHSVDWKRMYLERDLNLRLFFLEFANEKHEKINGENNTNTNTNNNSATDSTPDAEPEEDDDEKVDILDYLDDIAPYIGYLKVTMSNFNLNPFLAHVTKLQLTKFALTAAHVEAISKLNKVTDLQFTEMKIRDTTGVAKILSSLNTLSVLDLSDNIIDDNGIVPLCRSLEANNSLLRLSVAFNKLGGPSMGHLFKALKKHVNIELLDISHNNIFALDLEEDRYRDLKNNTSLKHLILDENPLGVDLVHKAFFNFKLARHSPTALNPLFSNIPNQLLSLSMRSTDLIPEHINTLGSHWATNTLLQLEFLSLANNEVRDEGAQALRDVLKVNRSIKILDLTRCDLKQQGAEALAACLHLNDCLEHLILDRNKILNTGAIKLVEAIKKNPHRVLKSLHFKISETSNEVTMRLEEELQEIGVVPYSDSTPDSTWRYKG
jgi:Ran GTPase-activating protein (RanGAP) involved in mRNA processing and transport